MRKQARCITRSLTCAVAAFLVTPHGCGNDPTGEKGRVSEPTCFMEVLHDGVSVSPAGVGATLRYWCTTPPVRQRTALRLQLRDTNGRWVTMDQREDRQIPTEAKRTLTVAAPCLAGLWRARGTAIGSLRGPDGKVQEYDPAQKDSPERLVTADDCNAG
ncbi:hypothetical protein [Nonomuraea bangladeshensis]|uniref:hypothetical protein n=1 Tax=Nonomuraea bangladeshensis TaxID=404385 RepID=UPI003C2F55AE